MTLPDDYRHFIQAIGDGAPGPDGGIAPLEYNDIGDRWEPLSDRELAALAEEFVGGEGHQSRRPGRRAPFDMGRMREQHMAGSRRDRIAVRCGRWRSGTGSRSRTRC